MLCDMNMRIYEHRVSASAEPKAVDGDVLGSGRAMSPWSYRTGSPRSAAVAGSLAASSRSAVASGSSNIGMCPHSNRVTQRVWR